MIRRAHTMSRMRRLSIVFFVAATSAAQTPVEVVRVISKAVERQVKLPGEFHPYLGVPIFAKVSGFVEKIKVDRGSVVKEGDLLATLVAPEMKAQIVEAQSKAQAIGLQRAEAAAKLAAAQSTYQRLKAAAATPGVVAENDVIVAEKTVEAAQALVHAYEDVQSLRELEQYLTIQAPFEGIITERDVHPGALVGPGSGSTPLVRLQQISRLRLVVAVPEALVGAIVKGARVPFTVPAFPGETFHGVLSRIAHALDEKTRTMAVELDVRNPGLRLGPGMYPEVLWPVKKPRPSLVVPPTSVVTTTERTFVIRVKDGAVEWVTVTRGAPVADLVEVFGPLKEGDVIARRGSDEL
ncbi:MAG: efflux RND transporter periplasmic adaptor subunit, partial [Acidobacteria bacterium]